MREAVIRVVKRGKKLCFGDVENRFTGGRVLNGYFSLVPSVQTELGGVL